MAEKKIHLKDEDYNFPKFHFDSRLRDKPEQLTRDPFAVTCNRCLSKMGGKWREMKARPIENPDGTEGRIFSLSKEEVDKLCRPGAGADTCIWLVMGGKGFECLYYNRGAISITGEKLEERWRAGLTVAKRDGCDVMRGLAKRVQ